MSPPEKWDGRRTHIVDRAADYVALHGQGLTVAQIARRRRRSKGYVSILLRLGQVLAALPPGEVAAYRSPRITWALAQRLVRADTPAVEVRAQLRYALGGFSTHNVDRRRRGLRAARGTGGADAATAPSAGRDATPLGARQRPPGGAAAGGSAPSGVLAGWGFDQALFDADAAGFARAHLERLAAVHQAVAARAARAVQQQVAGRLAVGQGLRQLARQMGRAVGQPVDPSRGADREAPGATSSAPPWADAAPAAHRAALDAFAVFEAGLAAAVRGALAVLEEARAEAREEARASSGSAGGTKRPAMSRPAPRPALWPEPRMAVRGVAHPPGVRALDVTPDELDAELAD